ncbi:MAG: pyridoxamine 5'-phosphate oxidase [Phycisphaerales bacterium]|nr:pyridoxamine 5'-phosphate oxidase [Phycisphaerales bacterium]
MPNLDQSDAMDIEQHLPDDLPADPMPLVERWLADATTRRVQPNPNAMALATVSPAGEPEARIVLLKKIVPNPGFVVFYTNYRGTKGLSLAANPIAAAALHWDALDRQVRFQGPVTRSPVGESDAYFASRPWLSRIGAWASDQSCPIESRRALAEKLDATLRRFGIDPSNPPPDSAAIKIPRPPYWGGFRIWVRRLELWVGGTGRLHDRAAWTRELIANPESVDGYRESPWVATRLQP